MALPLNSRSVLFRPGDVNAFFGLAVDNLTQMVIMASILTGVFGVPADVVLYGMIPGSVVGVLIGNLVFTRMAVSLAARTNRTDVTAMPLGIDTPSLFAFTFGIVGPAYLATHDGTLTWRIASAVIVTVGVVKIGGAFIGDAVRRVIPRAGLLGPIAAIALVLIAFFPSLRMMHDPIPAFISLGVILVCLIGRHQFPGRVPGAFAAVMVGLGVYYALQAMGLNAPHGALQDAQNQWRISLPWPSLGFIEGLPSLPTYLPIALPFALVVVIGGIDVTESASSSGDEYSAGRVILTDGVSTLIGGLCGAVVQTTPYIGHPAYKRMGGGAGYTLAAGLVVGLGGAFGHISFLAGLIPEAVVAPILIFIGLEITAQTFAATPKAHHPALAIAFIPVMADLVLIQTNALLGNLGVAPAALHGEFAGTYRAVLLLGNGFVVTALIWAGTLAFIIDGRLRDAAALTAVGAVSVLFGVMHSPYDNGRLFLPWLAETSTPWVLCAAYAAVSCWLLLMAARSGSQAFPNRP
ncbi:MAG TPA: MFS transporter [Nitrospiria bacterium]|nr:MFS transporter [Nitrospiria bacterium]